MRLHVKTNHRTEGESLKKDDPGSHSSNGGQFSLTFLLDVLCGQMGWPRVTLTLPQ